MPIVSRFFGIVIAFYWEDHPPPHFHAKYSGDEAIIEIGTGNVLRNGARPTSPSENRLTSGSSQRTETTRALPRIR